MLTLYVTIDMMPHMKSHLGCSLQERRVGHRVSTYFSVSRSADSRIFVPFVNVHICVGGWLKTVNPASICSTDASSHTTFSTLFRRNCNKNVLRCAQPQPTRSSHRH